MYGNKQREPPGDPKQARAERFAMEREGLFVQDSGLH
jgi:hypothetical protein